MNHSQKETLALLVDRRVSDELTAFLQSNEQFANLSHDAAKISQQILESCNDDLFKLFESYVEVSLRLRSVENHYTYMLGLSDIKEFEQIVGNTEWYAVMEKCVELFTSDSQTLPMDLDGWDLSFQKPQPFLTVAKRNQCKGNKKPGFRLVIAAVIASVMLLTGACIPKLYSFIVEGDTMVRQSGMLELPPKEGESFRSMEEALSYYGFKGAITWIPEAYALDYIKAKDIDGYLSIYAWYQSESDDAGGISFRCVQYQDPKELVERFEIEREGGEEAHTNGMTYFVTQNKETLRAVWNSGDCLFSLKGTITEAELQQIIKSIEKEE